MSFPRLPAAALALTAVALIAAGCGSSSSSSSSSTSSSQPSKAPVAAGASSGGGMTLTGASNPELGTIIVDSEGLTVYAFAKDQGTTSSCYGACAEAWPPVLTKGSPASGEGAMSSQLGTTKRKDGTVQVTYAGHPLYTFVEDSKPGEANGNGATAFGAEWNALEESGSLVPASAEGEGEEESSSESSGGGGYGY
jgi:predicted lipoprotein with Yx(FWY)xxD motif